MSIDLVQNLLYKKLSSFVSININSVSFQKANYFFLLNILEKSEYDINVLNFDPLFYRFFLTHKQPNTKYHLTSSFTFISSCDSLENIFSNTSNYLLVIGLNILEKEKIREFIYQIRNLEKLSKIIFVSFNIDNFTKNIINSNCIFSLNEISHAEKNELLFLKYDFYNHKKLNKENIVFSFGLNVQKGLIINFNEILIHNLELQKIFNEVEKPIEHKTQMNLKLTEEERKTKDNLVLPFMKSEDEKKKAFEITQEDEDNEEGEIDEDPDEDLDI